MKQAQHRLTFHSGGQGLYEVTDEIASWVAGQSISDGLLTVFFFIAGLELKREFVEGSLSLPADALVPIVAAVCGMVFPAS